VLHVDAQAPLPLQLADAFGSLVVQVLSLIHISLSDVALILATVAGPVFAVQAQKFVERVRAARDRREGVFKALMATRGTILSPRHVEALNMIELEFQDDEFRDVREAWRDVYKRQK